MDLMLFKDGLFVMIIGMGTVFIFLTVMIWAMYFNGKVLKIVNKYFPEEVPAEKRTVKKSENTDDEIALAIACAMIEAGKKQAA